MDEGSFGLGIDMQYTYITLIEFVNNISRVAGKYLYSIRLEKNIVYISASSESLFNLSTLLKFSALFRFESVMDLWGVDRSANIDHRFRIGYNFFSFSLNFRFILYITTSKLLPVQSLQSLYSSVGWLEREVWDMFGVFFYGHPDLRRILTDYGFSGFPLRKDFPLSGYTQVRYDEESKKVLSEPLELSQEFRYFNFLSPWERVL